MVRCRERKTASWGFVTLYRSRDTNALVSALNGVLRSDFMCYQRWILLEWKMPVQGLTLYGNCTTRAAGAAARVRGVACDSSRKRRGVTRYSKVPIPNNACFLGLLAHLVNRRRWHSLVRYGLPYMVGSHLRATVLFVLRLSPNGRCPLVATWEFQACLGLFRVFLWQRAEFFIGSFGGG